MFAYMPKVNRYKYRFIFRPKSVFHAYVIM